MKLSNLKPAWRQFRFVNSMQPMDRAEILWMLERVEGTVASKTHRYIINAIVCVVLIFCCQAG